MKAFLAEQLALAQVLFENLQAGQRVVEFEQLLLGQVLDGQHFGNPVAHPFGFIETVRGVGYRWEARP